jgi:hypothetical protein
MSRRSPRREGGLCFRELRFGKPHCAASDGGPQLRSVKSFLLNTEGRPMADNKALAELDAEIAAVRDNLRQLTEQAAAQSGAADEDLAAERIEQQQTLLDGLLKRRETVAKA